MLELAVGELKMGLVGYLWYSTRVFVVHENIVLWILVLAKKLLKVHIRRSCQLHRNTRFYRIVMYRCYDILTRFSVEETATFHGPVR